MKHILNKILAGQEGYCVLKHTTLITNEMVSTNDVWADIAQCYPLADTTVPRAILSIENAILTQNRIVFAITKESIGDLLREDPNHKDHSYDHGKYAQILKELCTSGLAKLEQPGLDRMPAIYSVIDQTLSAKLPANYIAQLAETKAFVEKRRKTKQK